MRRSHAVPSRSSLLLLTLALAGCSNTTKQNLALLGILRAPGPIQGQVLSGPQPLAGAHVYLFAAGATGYASESTSLLTAEVLASSPANSGVDSSGDTPSYFVITDANGQFSLTAGDTPDYACVPGAQLYLSATVPQSHAALLAVMGECPATGDFARAAKGNIQLDEASTATATYALSGYYRDATHIGAPASEGQGLAVAFAAAAR